jgi:hypothetical protein
MQRHKNSCYGAPPQHKVKSDTSSLEKEMLVGIKVIF